jgi:membrane fusion protein, multidrug efflux system
VRYPRLLSRANPTWANPTWLVVVGFVLLCVLISVWRGVRTAPVPASPPKALPVIATVVRPARVPMTLEAIGSLRAVREVMLAPEVAGRVVAIHFEAGTHVAAGQPLVDLYQAPEEADRAAALAQAHFASIQLDRSRKLAPSSVEPRQTLEQHEAELEQAQAAVRQLDARIEQHHIRAPFAGQLGIRRINPGQYLNAGDAIATLTDLDQLYVEFNLPQQDLPNVRVGAAVQVRTDAWPGRSFEARVNALEPKVEEQTRNVTVQALLPNPQHALHPGMYVTAVLDLPPQDGALVIPQTAIQTSAIGDTVVVVRGTDPSSTGQAESVPVTTGRRVGDGVVISQGLKAGDVVITQGQLRLQPGAPVKVDQLVPNKGS